MKMNVNKHNKHKRAATKPWKFKEKKNTTWMELWRRSWARD